MGPLTAEIMKKALVRLDELLVEAGLDPVSLIVGGGGAMILAHRFPLGTTDIDAVPRGIPFAVLDGFVKTIAEEQALPVDWLNPFFSTYSHTLPSDYATRLVEVFRGQKLRAEALGKEEMLIMKCFAHRAKDVGHAKALIKGGADVDAVTERIEELQKKGIPGAGKALEFLEDIIDQLEG